MLHLKYKLERYFRSKQFVEQKFRNPFMAHMVGARHGGAPGRLIIWRSLKEKLFKLFGPSQWWRIF
jgi:hypothetical protein